MTRRRTTHPLRASAGKPLRARPRPLPFVAVYEVHGEVQVLRILHGAQQWALR
jgi:plasmid stabilization system protein ParE